MTTVIGFLGSKTGAGTTSFVYHLAWLYAEQGYRVLAVDLDPQPNLTVRMVDEERLMKLWTHPNLDLRSEDRAELFDFVREPITSNLELLVGDPILTGEEELLAASWQRCCDGNERAFHWTLSFQRSIHSAAQAAQADIVLVDLAASPSAITRAALLMLCVLRPHDLPDLLSIHELVALVPRIEEWNREWRRLRATHQIARRGPAALARSVGYVLREQPGELGRSSVDWSSGIPMIYARVSKRTKAASVPAQADDISHLGTLKWYGSVLPMAEEARKPIFQLKPADGALGAHARVVREARKNFEDIIARIAQATWQDDE